MSLKFHISKKWDSCERKLWSLLYNIRCWDGWCRIIENEVDESESVTTKEMVDVKLADFKMADLNGDGALSVEGVTNLKCQWN